MELGSNKFLELNFNGTALPLALQTIAQNALNAKEGRDTFKIIPENNIEQANKEFVDQYNHRIKEALYNATEAIVEKLICDFDYYNEESGLYGPRITLERRGDKGTIDGIFSEARPMMTDMTGRWDYIRKITDEELAFSPRRIEDLDQLEGYVFKARKSYLHFSPITDSKDSRIETVQIRMKRRHLGLVKWLEQLYTQIFKEDLPESRWKIPSKYGVNDFGAMRVITDSRDTSDDMVKYLKEGKFRGIELVPGSEKLYRDETAKMDTGYEAWHGLLAAPDSRHDTKRGKNRIIELQIRTREEHTRAEKEDNANNLEDRVHRKTRQELHDRLNQVSRGSFHKDAYMIMRIAGYQLI